VEITRLQVKQFLDACARVVEHAKKYVITFAVPGQAINLRQQVSKFLLAQIAQYGAKSLLRWYSQNRAAQSSQ